MYNKKQFNKINNKNVLHKVKKQWIVVSLALFMMIGGGALSKHRSIYADNINNQSVQTIHNKTNSSVLNSKIDEKATQLHRSLLSRANNQSMRLGAYYGKHEFKGRFTRTNDKKLLKRDWFHYYRIGILTNRYAPYDRRAKLPRHFKIPYDTEWMMDKHGLADRTTKTPLYTSLSRNRWINDNYSGKEPHHRNGYVYRHKSIRKPVKNVHRNTYNKRTKSHKRIRRRIIHKHYIRRINRRHRIVRRRARAKEIYLIPDSNGESPSLSTLDVNKLKRDDTDIYQGDNSASSDYPAKKIVDKTNIAGYKLYHIMSDGYAPFDDDGWMLADEVSTHRRGHFNDNEFNQLIQSVDNNNLKRNFTSDEQQRINNIKQQYDYLKQNENTPDSDTNINDYRRYAVDWINFYRTVLYNLQPVSESTNFDETAQSGANMESDPEDMNWGHTFPHDTIQGFVTDSGDVDNDGEAGHRDSILNPSANKVGVGYANHHGTNVTGLFFDWGVNGTGAENGDPTDVKYPNEGLFPYNDATSAQVWSYQFKTHPYSIESDSIPTPEISVNDDTSNRPVNVSHIKATADEVYYKVDKNALHNDHQYTITISGEGIPNGQIQYSTKFFRIR